MHQNYNDIFTIIDISIKNHKMLFIFYIVNWKDKELAVVWENWWIILYIYLLIEWKRNRVYLVLEENVNGFF